MSMVSDFFKGIGAAFKGFRVTFRQMGMERVTMEYPAEFRLSLPVNVNVPDHDLLTASTSIAGFVYTLVRSLSSCRGRTVRLRSRARSRSREKRPPRAGRTS